MPRWPAENPNSKPESLAGVMAEMPDPLAAAAQIASLNPAPPPEVDHAPTVGRAKRGAGAHATQEGSMASGMNILEGVHLPNMNALRASGIPTASVEESWRKRGVLEGNTPPDRPGFVQRWIRTVDVDGKPDPMNVQSALLEGWRPRSPNTITGNRQYAIANDATFGSVLSVMGMVLMERSKDLEDEYRRRLTMESDRKTQAIYNNQFSGADARYAGTRYEQIRQTSVGGRVAPVDA